MKQSTKLNADLDFKWYFITFTDSGQQWIYYFSFFMLRSFENFNLMYLLFSFWFYKEFLRSTLLMSYDIYQQKDTSYF